MVFPGSNFSRTVEKRIVLGLGQQDGQLTAKARESEADLTIGLSSFRRLFIEGSLNSKLPTIWRVEKQMKSR